MKRTTVRVARLLCLTVLLAVMSQAIFARPEVKCVWKEHAIVVDGLNEEWIGSLTIIDKKDLALSVLRDEEFLYLGVLFSKSTQQMQILMQGMTVWFDPEGGTKKRLGVQFPSGSMEPRDFQDPENRGRIDAEQIDQIAREVLGKSDYFLVLVPEKDQQMQIGFSGSENIEVRAARQGHTLFYELKIPLDQTEDHPFGIGVRSDKKLGIGLETPRMDTMQRQMSSGRSGGMSGGMGGGMPGSTGGGMPGSMGGGRSGGMGGGRSGGMERPNAPSPLNVWIQVEEIEKAKK